MNSLPRLLAVFPRLVVQDVSASAKHYEHVLGFRISSTTGSPPDFCIVDREGVGVHLKRGNPKPGNARDDGWDVYFEVRNSEVLYAEFERNGARFSKKQETTEYGMREFSVVDPDGYVLCFAEDVGA